MQQRNVLTGGEDNRRQEAERQKQGTLQVPEQSKKHTALFLPSTRKTILFLMASEEDCLPETENKLLHENVNLFHGTYTGSEQINLFIYRRGALSFRVFFFFLSFKHHGPLSNSVQFSHKRTKISPKSI